MRGKIPALLTVAALTIAACGGDNDSSEPAADEPAAADEAASDEPAADDSAASGDAVSIRYSLWDANQLPGYESCATAFNDANPGISVEVEQLGWDDYWTGITTGFVSGTAPDVFTNHLARYPEFAETEQILALNDYIDADSVDTSIYFPGLVNLWARPDGNQYGLPKDWDTIALTVNNTMLADAGIDSATLTNLTWNPQDGGTFEELIAALSVDANGVRGNEEGFDASNVAVFGFGLVGTGGGNGQTEWSWLAASNGWTFMDQPFWGTEFNYDDPTFVETIGWIKSVIAKGYAPPFEVFSATGHNDLFKAGQTATTSLGSWEIGDILAAEFETTFFPTPVGPTGDRSSMFNGLADSISASTEHPDEAWEWVKFLASADCQNLVAETAVIFPAIPEAAETVKNVRAGQGVDVSAFTVHVENGTTFTFPIADYAADRDAIMGPAMQDIFTGADTASTLADANAEVNDLFR
ncbi:MAG: sugar ABC transporter substrate-binding protein [Ilumatobacter sp.]|jgi:multiple sugar transport system substrate-binding protein